MIFFFIFMRAGNIFISKRIIVSLPVRINVCAQTCFCSRCVYSGVVLFDRQKAQVVEPARVTLAGWAQKRHFRRRVYEGGSLSPPPPSLRDDAFPCANSGMANQSGTGLSVEKPTVRRRCNCFFKLMTCTSFSSSRLVGTLRRSQGIYLFISS